MDGRDLAELVAARGKVVDALNHLDKVDKRLTDPTITWNSGDRSTKRAEVRYFMASLDNWLSHPRDGFVPYIKNQFLLGS
jgi:hypothetical protein